MRNGQNKRMRGRNRRGHNPLTRVYESNGPDVKIRGTAHHVAEKYMQLARDAQTSGDPVSAEGYFQHAEHYFRMIAVAQAQFTQPNQQQSQFQRPEGDSRDDFDDEDDDTGPTEQPHAQPYVGGAPVNQTPRPQPQPPQPQPQPQPPIQGYPQQPRNEPQREGNLPAFITGGAGVAGQGQGQGPGPGPGQGNGMDNEQGGRDGGRFGRRRRRFRPRGPGDFEPRAEGAGEISTRSPVAPPAAANEARPDEGGVTPPKPVGSSD
jgi:hypothetical protein